MERKARSIREEAIQNEILDALKEEGKNADDYDIGAIADEIIDEYEDDYGVNVDGEGFWRVVAENKI
jgi:hypothetical protein